MKKHHYEMRFSGAGGQGMMLMGDILAWTAGCIEGKEILLTKSYGPESRGGASRSELIIDEDEIGDPEITSLDFMLAMTQTACDKYYKDLDADGILLVDSDLVKNVPKGIRHIYRLPLTRIAREVTGNPISANVVALGAVAVLGDCAERENIRTAVREHFLGENRLPNEAAFDAGAQIAQKAAGEIKETLL